MKPTKLPSNNYLNSLSNKYFRERYGPTYSLARGYIRSLQFFLKNLFGIRLPAKIDMPLNKETAPTIKESKRESRKSSKK